MSLLVFTLKFFSRVAVAGDERVVNNTYAINLTYWIMNKLASAALYDANGNKVSQTKYYYDKYGLGGIAFKGDLTEKAQPAPDNNSIEGILVGKSPKDENLGARYYI